MEDTNGQITSPSTHLDFSDQILPRFVSSFHQVWGQLVTSSQVCFFRPGLAARWEHHAAPLCHSSLHTGQVGCRKQSHPKDVSQEHIFILKESFHLGVAIALFQVCASLLPALNSKICHFLILVYKLLRFTIIHMLLFVDQGQCDPCEWDQIRAGMRKMLLNPISFPNYPSLPSEAGNLKEGRSDFFWPELKAW